MVNVEHLPRRAARFLREHAHTANSRHVTLGLDGFVDEIVTVVDKHESATSFTRVPTIRALSERIARAAGKSCNIELIVERKKLGGNGPIMANAMAALGVRVACVGALGYPRIHPAFSELAERVTVYSIAEPGHTDALEFEDGKLMLGKQQTLKDVTWPNLIERVGADRLLELFSESSLVGLQSWTMLPSMNDIWERILAELCPKLDSRDRTMFFDLADPEKRDPNDIARALELIGQFQSFFATYLGLNEKESMQVAQVLGYAGATDGEAAVKDVGQFILGKLNIAGVVIHPRAYAVLATPDGSTGVPGPFVEKPLISTGGGDHFNAGFCLGKLIGATDDVALQIGVATSGYYVRTGNSPGVNELADFLHSL